MRWRKIFPGTEDQVREVRRFVGELLVGHPTCDDVVLCAAELATNAIRHTASGRDGSFVTEVSWTGRILRVAVADEGAPTAPVWRPTSADMLAENDRGLDILARLSASCGSDGDYRGRVVWAEFPAGSTAPDDACQPMSPQPGTSADADALAGQYAAWHTWFGRWTGQWWALPKQASGSVALIVEPTAGALARRLDALQGDPRYDGPPPGS